MLNRREGRAVLDTDCWQVQVLFPKLLEKEGLEIPTVYRGRFGDTNFWQGGLFSLTRPSGPGQS